MPATVAPLAPGDAGSLQTLRAMGVESVRAAQDPRVRDAALAITAHVPERDVDAMIRAVFEWVQGHVRYQWDPYDAEFLIQPGRMVDDAAAGRAVGDCDDFVMLGAALLRALGLPVLLKAIAGDPRGNGLYDHVYLLAGDPTMGTWIPLDMIQRGKPPGWEAPTFSRWLVFDPGSEKIVEEGTGTKREPAVPGFGRFGDRTGET